ncbi:MAG: S9 family peptidase, partial [Pseudomonadales bacterium]
MTTVAPFGSWHTPLTAQAMVADVKGLHDIRSHGDILYWLETRPNEQGRTVLMARQLDGTQREVTPAPFNLRSRVHEYGGAAYLPCDAGIFFVNFADQRVYRVQGEHIEPVVDNDPDLRFADLCWDARRNRVIAVTEQHRSEGESVNRLQAFGIGDDAGNLTTLHEGHDFYAAPRLSPDGTRLAFICWDHPNM